MWHVLVFKLVMAGLKSLAKSSNNTIDDELIRIVEESVTLKTVKELF